MGKVATVPVDQQAKAAKSVVQGGSKHFCCFGLKQRLDRTAPVWKKLVFYGIYLPFVRFCYFRLHIPAISGIDRDGRCFWMEHEGGFTAEWQALQACERHGWFYHELPLDDAPLAAATIIPTANQQHPTSPAWDRYAAANQPLQAALSRLDQRVQDSDEAVRAYRAGAV